MTEQQQTPAKGADGQATPDPEANGAAEKKTDDLDLDTLRAEYEGKTKPSSEQQAPDKDDDDDVVDRVSARVRLEMESQRDEEKLYEQVLGDQPKELLPHVKGYVLERVRSDPALMGIWNERREKPDRFEKMVAKLSADFSKPFSKQPDPNVTADREAVAHAVRSGSNAAPEGKAPDFSKMTDAELRAFKDNL